MTPLSDVPYLPLAGFDAEWVKDANFGFMTRSLVGVEDGIYNTDHHEFRLRYAAGAALASSRRKWFRWGIWSIVHENLHHILFYLVSPEVSKQFDKIANDSGNDAKIKVLVERPRHWPIWLDRRRDGVRLHIGDAHLGKPIKPWARW